MAAATSSCSCINLLPNKSKPFQIHSKREECLFLTRKPEDLGCLKVGGGRRRNGDLIVRKVTPDVAGDVVNSVLPFGLGDNPWLAGLAGLFFGVPFLIQRLSAIAKGVDTAAETMEKVADVVGKMAEEVDKVAEEIEESLPEGRLKKMVHLVENIAEGTIKEAQVVEDLMDKVGSLDDKFEAILKKSKETDYKGPSSRDA